MAQSLEEEKAETAVKHLIGFIGDNPDREGLKETPSRVVKAYRELFSGYHFYDEDIARTLKTFEDCPSNEMVLLSNVEFYSTCEHHMAPFFGQAHIAYIPNGRVVGVSKLARLLEIYSRRLQIQERLTSQITEALQKHLNPLGCACIIRAKHFCMTCRGVNKQNSIMTTSSLRGEFEKLEVRAEFLSLIQLGS